MVSTSGCTSATIVSIFSLLAFSCLAWLYLHVFCVPVYEYAEDKYPNRSQAVRVGLQPPGKLITLTDYRARHSFYRRDRALQELSAASPLIAVWDDHDIANDDWTGGAQGHTADDGDWMARKTAAVRAYREWMPVRGLDSMHRYDLYRDFQFGDLASLLMLESRTLARTNQNEHPPSGGWVSQQLDELLGALSICFKYAHAQALCVLDIRLVL